MLNEHHFECIVCLEIMEDAVEFLCCFNTCCEKCAQNLEICPCCRHTPLQYRPSIQVRRWIGCMPITCSYCSHNTTRGEIKSHLKSCPQKPDTCRICSKEIPGTERLAHALNFHAEDIVKIYTDGALARPIEDRKYNERDCINLSKRSRLGKSGKYYCGKPLGPIACKCCNGVCGRTTGCNCVDCMKLDIEARNLPKGYLVNNAGIICAKNASGKVACMCLIDLQRRCGGEGNQCELCGKLERVWQRYASLTI